MAPTNMVTRCPQCGTSFRITPAQLQSARGAVRCGACLHIFKARDHLVGAKAPASESALVRKPNRKPTSPASRTEHKSAERLTSSATPKAPSPASPPKPEKTGLRFDQSRIDEESVQIEDDDFLISDDMDQPSSAEEDPFGIGDQAKSHRTHSLFERTGRSEDSEPSEPIDDTDESWAMSLLEEEDEQTASVSVEPASQTPSEEQSDFELMDEPETAPTPSEDAIKFHLAETEADAAHTETYQGRERIHAHDPERSALLMNIDPEPVEMSWTRKHARPRRWLWPSLVVLALLLLVVQIAWLQFDRWSRVEPYRSFYGAVCPLVGCELPELVDRSRIRAYNLVVRNHPDREGALMVDAILLNTARFDQPFPELVLEFSDLNGNTVAARQFTPAEYLSGELAGRSRMPANQPVHLTLELVDPGSKAVNYRAYIPE